MTNNTFKTKLTEYLDLQQVNYRLLQHQTPAISIEDAAKQRGIRQSQMVKAILLRDMGDNYALACVPGNLSVDPKKVRAVLDSRRMTCVDLSVIETITGYQIGTVTPLLLKHPMPIIFDHQILDEFEITISSGNNMAGIALSSSDLVELCQPIFANICR
ncbi:YbaK/EbsC family protein [Vibrio sp. 404]|uniref:YbaK/EbsC family protein n=1 Tax=Vibrio marinisediminis TaxID=2758441 RepID=A0A7W2FTD7_9VIBR|nr:YbaK/EbsC family protein [Vibrio marinisediminis]MBA5763860.1 YbaK/EbsC family protein [Vibrio marinisediminis]